MLPKRMQSPAEDTGLFLIPERFSKERETRQLLLQAIPSFQSFYPDYHDGLSALKPWQESTSGEAPAMARAHAALLEELEQGVRPYLEMRPPSAPGPGELWSIGRNRRRSLCIEKNYTRAGLENKRLMHAGPPGVREVYGERDYE